MEKFADWQRTILMRFSVEVMLVKSIIIFVSKHIPKLHVDAVFSNCPVIMSLNCMKIYSNIPSLVYWLCCRSWWWWLQVTYAYPCTEFKTMDRVTGGGVLQLALAGAGVLLLYRILARLRPGVSLQDAVVVITGASSGLGKGQPLFFTCSSAFVLYLTLN